MKNVLFLLINSIVTSAHAVPPRIGTYEVPVSDELKPYANYTMEIKDDEYEKGPNIFTFPLPVSLIGKKKIFKIVRDANTDTWRGEGVSGVCQIIKKYFQCKVKFENLTIDKGQVKAAIQNAFPQEEVEKRFAVAMLFAGEPIGIVTYEMTNEEQRLNAGAFLN